MEGFDESVHVSLCLDATSWFAEREVGDSIIQEPSNSRYVSTDLIMRLNVRECAVVPRLKRSRIILPGPLCKIEHFACLSKFSPKFIM